MIDHISTLVFLHSLVNEETKNITLIEILEQLNIEIISLPNEKTSVTLSNFDLVTLWRRSKTNQPSRGRGRVLLITPSGSILLHQEYEIDLYDNFRCNAIFKINGLEIQEEGDYEFQVQLIDEIKAEWQTVGKTLLPIILN